MQNFRVWRVFISEFGGFLIPSLANCIFSLYVKVKKNKIKLHTCVPDSKSTKRCKIMPFIKICAARFCQSAPF